MGCILRRTCGVSMALVLLIMFSCCSMMFQVSNSQVPGGFLGDNPPDYEAITKALNNKGYTSDPLVLDSLRPDYSFSLTHRHGGDGLVKVNIEDFFHPPAAALFALYINVHRFN